jgi:membrane-associated phospholipid phosphatase
MRKFSFVNAPLLFACLSVGAFAQPLPIDKFTPALTTPWNRQIANIASDVTVAASIALDTWDSWKSQDGKRAFTKQAERTAIILSVTELTKRLVHRERPDQSDRLSFYSEHTAFAASAIGGQHCGVSIPLTFGTGAGRILAGRHYLTDTLVGAVVGFTVGRYIR